MRVVIAGILLSMAAGLFAQTATITGKVSFSGKAPASKAIDMKADAKCAAIHGNKPVKPEDFVLNPNGTLRWCFVYVKDGPIPKAAPSKATVVLDQHGCTYAPRVFGVVTGQPIEIRNSDPLLHNVHTVSKANPTFNIAQPNKGMKRVHVFMKPETMVQFKCDVHPWMGAYVGVVPHGFFAVTGTDGKFAIKGLPAGTYTLEVWHEKLGKQTMQVTVKAGETKTADFAYKK